jgi:histidine triad (HIT) family protein
MNEECIFCKITDGEIPSTKIYEDNDSLAFLDIQPVALGHILVITKEHYKWMQDVPDEILSKSFLTAKKLTQSIIDGMKCDYVQVGVVGKDVSHFHIHLIPRYFDDNIKQPPTISYSSDKERDEIAERIKSAI